MKIALALLALLALAWLFLRKKTAAAPVTGAQYVPAPTAPPQTSSGGFQSILQGSCNVATSVGTKAVGLKSVPGVGAACKIGAEIEYAVGKYAVQGAVTGAKAVAGVATTAATDTAKAAVRTAQITAAAGKAVVAAPVAAAKAVGHAASSVGHAIASIF